MDTCVCVTWIHINLLPWWTPTFSTSQTQPVPRPPHSCCRSVYRVSQMNLSPQKNSLKCKWQWVYCQEPSVAEHQLFCLSASSTNKSTVCSLLAGEHCDTILSITLHGEASFAWLWVIHQINTTYTWNVISSAVVSPKVWSRRWHATQRTHARFNISTHHDSDVFYFKEQGRVFSLLRSHQPQRRFQVWYLVLESKKDGWKQTYCHGPVIWVFSGLLFSLLFSPPAWLFSPHLSFVSA